MKHLFSLLCSLAASISVHALDIWIHPTGQSSCRGGNPGIDVAVDTSNANPLVSADSFDTAIRTHSAAGNTFRLCPGTYKTRGGYVNYLSNNAKGFYILQGANSVKFIGSGTNQTTIKLVDAHHTPSNNTAYNYVFGSWQQPLGGDVALDADNVVISDMTIDCNFDGLKTAYPNISLTAIQLAGSNIRLSNLKIIGAAGDRLRCGCVPNNYDEMMIVWVGSSAKDSVGNLIENCWVNFRNDYGVGQCSAIGLYAAPPHTVRGTVRNCEVHLNGHGGEFAYNAGSTAGVLFENNRSYNAARGFNSDITPAFSCLHFKNNKFYVPANGHGMFLLNTIDSAITGNEFHIQGPGARAITVAGPITQCSWGTESKRLLIKDNTVFKSGSWTGYAVGFNFNPTIPVQGPGGCGPMNVTTSPVDLHVQGNIINSYFYNVFPNNPGSVGYITGNYDQNGGQPVQFPTQPTSSLYRWQDVCATVYP